MKFRLAVNAATRYILLLPLLFVSSFAIAQLNANFTSDKAGGCTPLTVSFTNTTTGASAAATYKWDLGNGNTSTLKNPGGTYRDEKIYTVTLTVTDAGQTATKTLQLTVYKKPIISFTPSVTKGCVPLVVNFNSSSTPGDGTISSYLWDFGDGNTQPATVSQQEHTYNFPQKSAVSLTVTNSYGCYNTLQKPNLIEALPGITVAFSADKTILCKVGGTVKFTNASTGPADITWLWDFGDGTTATEKEPSHIYSKKGTFAVKLTVSSAAGCSQSGIKDSYINVENFTTDFDVPALICQNTVASFTNKSSANPTSAYWMIDNQQYNYYYGNYPLEFTFTNPGTHTIKLVNTFGTCQEEVSKSIVVKASPRLNGFIADMGGVCGAPVTVKFKDTTAGAVKWAWDFNWQSGTSVASVKEPSFTYNSENYYTVALTVTNAEGCSAKGYQSINVHKPQVHIYVASSSSQNGTSGCKGLAVKFAANPADQVASYKWDLGDGTTSTLSQPEHTYTKAGSYTIKLSVITKDGCTTSDVYYTPVNVYEKPDVDFVSLSGTTICGNTPVTISATSTSSNWGSDLIWLIDDVYYSNGYSTQFTHQFRKDTTYSITLISGISGCRDTVTKKDYIKVLPPFPYINSATNTCDGNRGTVTFSEVSEKALQYKWDFGDGTPELVYSTRRANVTHTYAKTGAYKVVHTAVNGQCSVRDSVTSYVLLKQKPVLTAAENEVCGSTGVQITLSNYEVNPYPYQWYSNYYYDKIQYGDGTMTNATNLNYYSWSTGITSKINELENGKNDFRIITSSSYFNCSDTTNYVPIKIKGPVADYEIITNNTCYKRPIVFSDSSKGTNNVALKKWEWSFGDGNVKTFTNNSPVSYVYPVPGQYYTYLKVTDADGCSASTYYVNHYATTNGPKADFYHYPASVEPNTTVTFYNNSNYYNSYNALFKWIFSDGTTSTDYNPTRYYPVTGTDTVKLVVKNVSTGCSDTSVQVINIKNINASFTYTSSYINNNSCPPVIVRFTNTSVNVSSISWDFGDGSRTDNQNFPSHTYYKPGVYLVTLYATTTAGLTDSIVDSITVKGPYATLKADVLSGCGSQNITLSAEVKNATSYTWDFADGELKESQDTFALHNYTVPGVYTPSLILKDGGGCSATSELADKIVIDTLQIAITKTPQRICDSAQVQFNAGVLSLAADELQQTLTYHWNFGTGVAVDTSNIPTPTFNFNNAGKYPVLLIVTSPYGCIKQTVDTIEVFKHAKGSISGPAEICQETPAQFSATANMSTNLSWEWMFNNGNTSTIQNPASQAYNTDGTYEVKLIVNNNGCYDTTTKTLLVRAKPAITLSPKDTTVCLGKSVQLAAGGGTAYSWAATPGLNNYTIANPVASPTTNKKYVVEVTNEFGCKSKDSTMVNIAAPFKIKVPADTFVCRGNSAQLYATGAASFKWINVTTGLSATNINNPVATPVAAAVYSVVGYDAFQCFTDTAAVRVGVESFPSVSAGPDMELQTGSVIQLKPVASSDVVKYSWSPADYLSCTNCQSPTSTPRSAISYVVKATNKFGCAAYDTIDIKLVCTQSRIYIPSAYTPNKDYKNDVFYIKGAGVKMVKYMKIYNRLGQVVFERTNFNVNDPSSGWDGVANGYDVPSGAYVYFTEMICDTGETFSFKGTVVVIR